MASRGGHDIQAVFKLQEKLTVFDQYFVSVLAATPHFWCCFPILDILMTCLLCLFYSHIPCRTNPHLSGLSPAFLTAPSAVLSNVDFYILCHEVCTYLNSPRNTDYSIAMGYSWSWTYPSSGHVSPASRSPLEITCR